MTLHFDMFCIEIFLTCRVSTFRVKKIGKNMAVIGVNHACLLIELGTICISMAVSFWFKSCADHSVLKSYNGGLWKNIYKSGSYYDGIYYFPSINLDGQCPCVLLTCRK